MTRILLLAFVGEYTASLKLESTQDCPTIVRLLEFSYMFRHLTIHHQANTTAFSGDPQIA